MFVLVTRTVPHVIDIAAFFSYQRYLSRGSRDVLNLYLCSPSQPMNTSLALANVDTSRPSNAVTMIRLNRFRNRFRLVTCQLLRLRLWPTAQTMKAGVTPGTGRRKVTEVRDVQLKKAFDSILRNLCGKVMDTRPEQLTNASSHISVIVSGSVREVILSHWRNAA